MPKTSPTQLLQLIHLIISAHRISIQKSIVFLYANRETSEKKLSQTIPLSLAMIIKYLVVNVTKEVFYNENNKILVKEIQRGYKQKGGNPIFTNGNN